MEENICRIFIAEGLDVKTSQQQDDIFWQWLFMVHQYTEIKQKAYIFTSNVPILFPN